MRDDTTCKSCGAPIRWAITAKGHATPLDLETVEDGDQVLEETEREDGRGTYTTVRKADPLLDGDQPKYKSHFATCPNAASHRRRKR